MSQSFHDALKRKRLFFSLLIVLALTFQRTELNGETQEQYITTLMVPMKPICLVAPFFGQTSNNIIEIGKLLRFVQQEGKNRNVALDAAWSDWYQVHFENRSDVALFYHPYWDCHKIYDGRSAFYANGWDMSHLAGFVPKAKYRRKAKSILQAWSHGTDYISVHRRDLDGTCNIFAECAKFRNQKCQKKRDPHQNCSTALRRQACNIEYQMVPNPFGRSVVLFTDGQVPQKDATFPYKFKMNTSILVEMWLMVHSTVHWGNPRSSLDIIVSSWRHGIGMEPRSCYNPQSIVFQP